MLGNCSTPVSAGPNWHTIFQLIMFSPNTSTNCQWMSLTVRFCAHRNRTMAHRTHLDTTCINNSIFVYWFLRIYCPVHFEIFTVLPQNPTPQIFFSTAIRITVHISQHCAIYFFDSPPPSSVSNSELHTDYISFVRDKWHIFPKKYIHFFLKMFSKIVISQKNIILTKKLQTHKFHGRQHYHKWIFFCFIRQNFLADKRTK